MRKRIFGILLALAFCLALPSLPALADGPSVSATYSGGVVRVTGSGFDSGTEYVVRVVDTGSDRVVSMTQTTSGQDGSLSVAVTTGAIANLNSCVVYVNGLNGALVAQDSTIAAQSGGSGGTGVVGGGGGGGAGSGSVTTVTSGNTATASASVTASTGTSGTATAAVPAGTVTGLIDAAKSAESGGRKAVVKIEVAGTAASGAVEVKFSGGDFAKIAGETSAAVKIETGIGAVTFDAKAVDAISAAAGAGDVVVTVAKADAASLTGEAVQVVGDRPVYELEVKAGGITVTGFGGGSALVSVPYTLKSGEDPKCVIVCCIGADGGLQVVRGAYNTKTGTVDFKVAHFSKYAVGYRKVSFADVPAGSWYSGAVTFIAARGITQGTSAGVFSPDMAVTRGQFIVMLMRAYGLQPEEGPADNFADAGNAYYTGYLAAAKKLGIAQGVGGNMFAPEREVTRQEMFTLLYRALEKLGELPEASSGKTISSFSDAGDVADWAYTAVDALVRGGIVSGSDGKLSPAATSSRAQMAQVLYNLLSL